MQRIYPFTVKPANDTEEFYNVLLCQKEIVLMHESIITARYLFELRCGISPPTQLRTARA